MGARLWFMVYGLSFIVYRLWFMVYRLSFMEDRGEIMGGQGTPCPYLTFNT